MSLSISQITDHGPDPNIVAIDTADTTDAPKTVDEEWMSYISSNFDDDIYSNTVFNKNTTIYDKYVTDAIDAIDPSISASSELINNVPDTHLPDSICPTDLYISTKTKIVYINTHVDLTRVFGEIPIIDYHVMNEGVIKKQIKLNSNTPEELAQITKKLQKEYYYEEYIITNIDNPVGRIKFKDTRKISIGINKKNIMNFRSKPKSAFYNCVVIIFRVEHLDGFKEVHVKLFNTGKIEIPGVQSSELFDRTIGLILKTLRPLMGDDVVVFDKVETILINSNFNCGFYINREMLSSILTYKYNIRSIYDPCSYPGIQCKFYYNPLVPDDEQTGRDNPTVRDDVTEVPARLIGVSFMIFRTGSVLIVGKCEENVIRVIYQFLKKMLVVEYSQIKQSVVACSIGVGDDVAPTSELNFVSHINSFKKQKVPPKKRKRVIQVSSV